ncbi:MAG TPA: fibronectin type III domain-containing protein [Candidatus Polarisedimenticolia bacterium]|jgi:hypothetical protein|nr:fibronectin type III domain-containing protein [Candidatus Polarisedimenticolia bacterium]
MSLPSPTRPLPTVVLVLIAGACLCGVLLADPVWINRGPGGGGAWAGIAFRPQDTTGNTVLIGTDVAGAFRTTDGASTFSSANGGFQTGVLQSHSQPYWMETFTFDPTPGSNTVYAGSLETLLRSTDGGVNWTPVNSNFADSSGSFTSARRSLRRVVIDPTNTNIVYGASGSRFEEPYGIGTEAENLAGDGCVFKDTVGPAGSEAIEDQSLIQSPEEQMCCPPGHVCCPVGQPDCSPALYGSPLPSRPVVFSIVVDPANGRLLASTNKGIFRKDPPSAAWTKVPDTGLPHDNARALVLDNASNTLYLVLQSRLTVTTDINLNTYADPTTWQGGVYKAAKSDWGSNWAPINGVNGTNDLQNPGFEQQGTGGKPAAKWTALPNTVAARDTAIKRTGTASMKLTAQAGGGDQGVESDSITITGGKRYEFSVYSRAGAGSGSGVRKIYARFKWFSNSTPVPMNPVCNPTETWTDLSKDTHATVSTWQRYEGSTYAPAAANRVRIQLLTQDTAGTTHFDDAVVQESKSLSRVDQINDVGANYRTLAADSAHAGTVYVGTWGSTGALDQGVWRTTDYGASWERVTRQAPDDPNDSVSDTRAANDPNVCFQAPGLEPIYMEAKGMAGPNTILYVGTGFWLYKSANGGTSWSEVTSNENGAGTNRWSARGETNNVLAMESATEPGNPARIFYGDGDNALQISDDGGTSWLMEGIKKNRNVWWDLLGDPRHDGPTGAALIPGTVTSIVADSPNHVYVAANCRDCSDVGAVLSGTFTGGQWQWTPVGYTLCEANYPPGCSKNWPAGGPVYLAKDDTNHYLYASITGKGFYRYLLTNPFAQWQPFFPTLPAGECPLGDPATCDDSPTCDTANPCCVCDTTKIAYDSNQGRIYLASGDPTLDGTAADCGLWVSTSQGSTWTRATDALMANEPVLAIAPLPTGEVLIGARGRGVLDKGGVYKGVFSGSWQFTQLMRHDASHHEVQPDVTGVAFVPGNPNDPNDPDKIYASSMQGASAAVGAGPGIYQGTYSGGAWSFAQMSPDGIDHMVFSGLRSNPECQGGFPLIATTGGGGAFITSVVTPAPPLALSGSSPIGGTIVLNWSDASDTECGFKVERSAGNNQNYQELTQKAAFNQTSYSDSGLDAGTYYYRMRSFNAAGASSYSNEISVFTGQAPCVHCAAAAGFCDGQPSGTPCGLPACGGVCRSCGGQFDCFKP